MLIENGSNTSVEYFFRKVDIKEIRQNKYNKTNGWDFSWNSLHGQEKCEVIGLYTKKYPNEAQGLIALEIHRYDTGYGFVRVLNISSSPLNKKKIKGLLTLTQRYKGVGKCLVAFACQYSIELGFEGFVDLQFKTATKGLYLNLGADNPVGDPYIIRRSSSKSIISHIF